jgi:hypothetical protein
MKQISSLLTLVFCLVVVVLNAQKVETRSLSDFNRIDISGGFDKVILKYGDAESVRIESNGKDSDKVNTSVKGNTLSISFKSPKWGGEGRTNLVITYRNLREVNNSGSTNIRTGNAIKGSEFTYNGSGSGDFTAEVDVKNIKVNISGSSNVTLKGRADEQAYAVSGSGDIHAGQLKGESARTAVSGSGNVELNVSGHVKSSVSGSGKVRNVHE